MVPAGLTSCPTLAVPSLTCTVYGDKGQNGVKAQMRRYAAARMLSQPRAIDGARQCRGDGPVEEKRAHAERDRRRVDEQAGAGTQSKGSNKGRIKGVPTQHLQLVQTALGRAQDKRSLRTLLPQHEGAR